MRYHPIQGRRGSEIAHWIALQSRFNHAFHATSPRALQGDTKRHVDSLKTSRATFSHTPCQFKICPLRRSHNSGKLLLFYPSLDLIRSDTEFDLFACKLKGIDAIGVIMIMRSRVRKKYLFQHLEVLWVKSFREY